MHLYPAVIYVYVVTVSRNMMMINVLYVEKNIQYHTKFIIKFDYYYNISLKYGTKYML